MKRDLPFWIAVLGTALIAGAIVNSSAEADSEEAILAGGPN